MLSSRMTAEGIEDLDDRLAALQVSVKDLRPVWPQVEQVLIEVVKKHFETRGGYGGVSWPELSNRYAMWKRLRYGDKSLLHLTERLYGSLTAPGHADHVFKSGPTFMEFGTRVPYARAHHYGRAEINLPRRIVLPKIRDREKGDIVDVIFAYLIRSMRRGLRLGAEPGRRV